MEKICNKCKKAKSLEEFSKLKKAKDGRANSCKLCDNERHRKDYNKNEDYRKRKKRKSFNL